MTSEPLRIGNREREAACRALDEHLAEGRLDIDEYADRYAKAGFARIESDLDDLFRDLPPPHPRPTVSFTKAPADAPRPGREWSRPNHRTLIGVVRVAALIAAVMIAVPLLAAWWVLGIVVPMVFCHGPRRRHNWARRGAWTYGPVPGQPWHRGWVGSGPS